MRPPPLQKSRAIWWAILLLLLSAPTALAWTTAEIRQAPMEQWVIQDIHFDPRPDGTVAIHYRVTEPTYVLLRAHAKFPPFPLFKQILHRALRNPGTHEELWNGRDESGHPIEPLQWQMTLRGEPVNFTPTQDELEGARANPPNPLALMTSHHLHDPARCGVLPVGFDNLQAGSKVSGTMMILLRLQGAFRGYGRELGLQVQVFADEELLNDTKLEPPQVGDLAFFPLTVDFSKVTAGQHLLRVVVTDWADHHGTASVEVEVVR